MNTPAPTPPVPQRPGTAPAEPAVEAPLFPHVQGPKRVLLMKIFNKVKEALAFADILPQIEEDMLEFLDAMRLTVYQNAGNGK
ncbi:MAG: hypothetical protein G8345_08885, partial [Magnetococcales bacterium]|nr:hypothetical protein [Magnetococcales bacterium]